MFQHTSVSHNGQLQNEKSLVTLLLRRLDQNGVHVVNRFHLSPNNRIYLVRAVRGSEYLKNPNETHRHVRPTNEALAPHLTRSGPAWWSKTPNFGGDLLAVDFYEMLVMTMTTIIK